MQDQTPTSPVVAAPRVPSPPWAPPLVVDVAWFEPAPGGGMSSGPEATLEAVCEQLDAHPWGYPDWADDVHHGDAAWQW